jgi:hypothetical protein
VALPIGFNLWGLHPELAHVPYVNDESIHASMVRWAHDRISSGHLPLDGWYPWLSFGASRFHHYQSLPHVIIGFLGSLFGPMHAFRWSTYLLLSFWPLSVYWGVRLLGWDRWSAGLAALVSPLVASIRANGYEYNSYTWQGWGTWTQLWGMWLLPLAWGLSWRAVARRGSYALAAVVLALTIAVHFLTGYLALLALGVWVIVHPPELLKRLGRGLLVGVGALVVASWVLVPLIVDRTWTPQSEYSRGTFYYNSFGGKTVLRWLLTGEIFDFQRGAVLTLLVGLGLIFCVLRFLRDERARAVLGVGALSLLLFSGRSTLGPLLKVLPGSSDLYLNRYIMGVQLAGIFLAGIGLAWAGRTLLEMSEGLVRRAQGLATAALVVIAVVILAPAWKERIRYAHNGDQIIHAQQMADVTDGRNLDALIAEAKRMGPGRIYGGARNNWGQRYRVGFVPVYIWLLDRDADAVGFVRPAFSLSSNVEPHFNDTDPAQYRLFDVRYLLTPPDRAPSVPATRIDRRGRHTLWEVKGTTGYLQLVDTTGSIRADRTNIGARTAHFLASNDLARDLYPTIDFAGRGAAPPTTDPAEPPRGPPGEVTRESPALQDGKVVGGVIAKRRAMVMLKASFDPRWRVVVDGTEYRPQMVAPSFVGREIPPGRHTVAFVYQPYPHYVLLIVIGVLTLLGLAMGQRFGPRLRTRGLWRRQPSGPPRADSPAPAFRE